MLVRVFAQGGLLRTAALMKDSFEFGDHCEVASWIPLPEALAALSAMALGYAGAAAGAELRAKPDRQKTQRLVCFWLLTVVHSARPRVEGGDLR